MRHQHTIREMATVIGLVAMLITNLVFFTGCAVTSATHLPTAQEEFADIDDPFDDPFADAADLDDPNAIYRDPWEPANTKTFAFNLKLDRFFLKPIATVYDWAMPNTAQRGIKNVFTNLAMPKRFFNSIFQGKFDGAGREFARFTINSTAGIGGLFDIASHPLFSIEPSNEDTGQTFAFWGADSGPYVVLPLLGPSSIRDGIGLVFDAALEPLTYISFFVLPTATGYGVFGAEVTNDRSLHIEAFDNIETTSLDFYSSVQDAYFQFREAAIKD